ncbi:Nucleoredoxin-like [Oopsacas minuta]|uniref:Nucleoredoxin-like n=1 Tax=Oopsacas minuta TaxID=111878 RepID=A0AAV7K415_9METZ|nr:Nucleoredoxin-like [Oopsacas minuta]
MASGDVFTNMFGNTLLRIEGGVTKEIETSTLIKDGVIALYFSAHWCPPCRTFTPTLGDWYKKLTSGSLKDKLEIVFLSSDQSEEEFKDYYSSMPWCALPYSDREKKAELSKKFGIKGIPSLIFLNAQNGKIITREGREVVNEDPEGEQFPWKPKSISEVLSCLEDKLVDNKGGQYKLSEIRKDKYLALYISAHWCPPCKVFTPKLVEAYQKHQDKGFEVIFISFDRDEESFKDYFETMPWKSANYADANKLGPKIARRFGVKGIPTLVLMDKNLEVINQNARSFIEHDEKFENFPWSANICTTLNSEKDFAYLVSHPAVLYTVSDESKFNEAMQILDAVSKKFIANKPRDAIINFFCYVDDEKANSACKEFFHKGCGGVANQVFIIDPQEQMKNKEPITKLDVDSIYTQAMSYIEGELDMVKVD